MISRERRLGRDVNVFTMNKSTILTELFTRGNSGSKFCMRALYLSRASGIKENSQSIC